MSWDYRAVKHPVQKWYSVKEVYYTDGKIDGWAQDSMEAGGETVEELIQELELMLKDVKTKAALVEEDGKLIEEPPNVP